MFSSVCEGLISWTVGPQLRAWYRRQALGERCARPLFCDFWTDGVKGIEFRNILIKKLEN